MLLCEFLTTFPAPGFLGFMRKKTITTAAAKSTTAAGQNKARLFLCIAFSRGAYFSSIVSKRRLANNSTMNMINDELFITPSYCFSRKTEAFP